MKQVGVTAAVLVLLCHGCSLQEGSERPEGPGLSSADVSGSEGGSRAPLDLAGPADAGEADAFRGHTEAAPCVVVEPQLLEFGEVLAGQQAWLTFAVRTCSKAPVEISSVFMKKYSSVHFSVELAWPGPELNPDLPFALRPGEEVVVVVMYLPLAPSTVADDGTVSPDQGIVVVSTNDPGGDRQVGVVGTGVSALAFTGCPVAVIGCAEGDEVIPQTIIHLYGDESYAMAGYIKKWEWDVDPPQGSQSVFEPANSVPNPTFEANVAGVYTFSLHVYD